MMDVKHAGDCKDNTNNFKHFQTDAKMVKMS